MNEFTSPHRNTGAGRPWLWLTLLLGALLLGYMTAVGIRHNPYVSDVDANGISKYRFLRECRELAHDADKLNVGAMGQTIPLKTLVEQGKPLAPTDTITAELHEAPARFVGNVGTVEGGGWTVTTPASIGVTRGGVHQTLGDLPLQCTYTRKDRKMTAQVQLPGQ